MEQPFISIIIVNWNGMKWLEKCLASLSKQSYSNIQVVLVDNNSSDDSVDYVSRNFPNVIIVKSEKNIGFAGGNNLGIAESQGEFILLLNNDTWVEKDFISDLLAEKMRKKVDVISPREGGYNSGKQYESYITQIDLMGHPVNIIGNRKKKYNFYLTGVCLLFTRSLYMETGGLDADFFMYCEEVDWFWRLIILNKQYSYTDKVTVYHAGSGSSSPGLNYNIFLWRNENTLQMLLKNYSWISLTFILPMYFVQNCLEMVILTLIFKPKIASTYYKGWWYNLKNIGKIMSKRKLIQGSRDIADTMVMKRMYYGPGKFHHLAARLKNYAK